MKGPRCKFCGLETWDRNHKCGPKQQERQMEETPQVNTHELTSAPPVNSVNKPSDRKVYMKVYMAKRRATEKLAKAALSSEG